MHAYEVDVLTGNAISLGLYRAVLNLMLTQLCGRLFGVVWL